MILFSSGKLLLDHVFNWLETCFGVYMTDRLAHAIQIYSKLHLDTAKSSIRIQRIGFRLGGSATSANTTSRDSLCSSGWACCQQLKARAILTLSLLQMPSGPIDLGLVVDGPSPQRPITVAPCSGADRFLHIYSASAGKRVSSLGWAANAEPVVQPSGLVEMYPFLCHLLNMSIPPSPCWRWVRDDFFLSFRIFYGSAWKWPVFIVLMIDLLFDWINLKTSLLLYIPHPLTQGSQDR